MSKSMFKKGQLVYEVFPFSRDGRMKIRLRIVDSCGAMRGTLCDGVTGRMTKSFFYVKHYDETGRNTCRGNFSGLYAANEYTPEQIQEIALQIGREQIAFEIEHCRSCSENNPSAPRAYHEAIDKMLQNVLKATATAEFDK